jgi:GTP1/Obg family GTP-binding protein
MSQQPPFDKKTISEAVKEAEKEATMFNPRERAAYVKDRVLEIRRLRSLGQTDEQIKTAAGSFVEQYPTLFQMAVEPNFNEANFRMMVGAMEQMANGRLSQHEASVAVGQNLVDKYVMPLVQDKDKKKKH